MSRADHAPERKKGRKVEIETERETASKVYSPEDTDRIVNRNRTTATTRGTK